MKHNFETHFNDFHGGQDFLAGSAEPPLCRSVAATILWRSRKKYKIKTIVKGEQWEICIPEVCSSTPTDCGILTILFNLGE